MGRRRKIHDNSPVSGEPYALFYYNFPYKTIVFGEQIYENHKSVNVVDVTQSVLQDVFVMVMLGEIDRMDCSMSELSDELSRLGGELGLDIRVMHEDIFNSMHRI